jgi:flagellin
MPIELNGSNQKNRKIKEDRTMSLRIMNNIAALNAHRHLMVSDAGLSKSLERLSSGYRINVAADDAAGLAISERFRAQVASLKVAQRNVSEANALLQTAEGGMIKIGEILTRMKELATQAASGNAGDDIGKLSNEYNALVLEIDRISDSTKYADKALLDGTFNAGNTTTSWDAIDNISDVNVLTAAVAAYTADYAAEVLTLTSNGVSYSAQLEAGAQVNFSAFGIGFTVAAGATLDVVGAAIDAAELTVAAGSTAAFQVGYSDEVYDRIGLKIDSLKAEDLNLGLGDIGTAAEAQAILGVVEDAISTVAEARGDIGAYQNRMGYAAGNLSITVENYQAAESVIRDVDMAFEMTEFTKNQILIQSGTAMLAQANLAPQQVLALFG